MSDFDVAIVGGGPGGLAAALALGRARKETIVFDAGPPRNAAATHLHNFVTRDGIAPADFRRIAREQLRPYGSVAIRDERVSAIAGERDNFILTTPSGDTKAKRVILCTGMVDEMLDLPGFKQAWGHSIYQCPYCHGWEVRGQRWGFLALDLQGLQHGFPAMLTSWTSDVVVFTSGLQVPAEIQQDLKKRGIRLETQPVTALATKGNKLTP